MPSYQHLPSLQKRGRSTLNSALPLVAFVILGACSTEPESETLWPGSSCDADMTCEDLFSPPQDMQDTLARQDMQQRIDQGTQPDPPADQGTQPDPPTDQGTPFQGDMRGPTCQGGDGTCPAGCDLSNDSDCTPDCSDPATWPAGHAEREANLLSEINAARAQGANCGSRGSFPPASPVQMSASLQAAARCHSVDMVENIKGLDHTGSNGSSFSRRAKDAGYTGSPAGENIAAGSGTAEGTIRQWMGSDGHCANIMKSDITRIGTGYFSGNIRYTHYWTLVTGKGGQ